MSAEPPEEPQFDLLAELFGLLKAAEAAGAPYCLIGGWAVGFHATPRATNDIDLLTIPEAADDLAAAICTCGFFESAEPWTFSDGVTLRRFAKCRGRDVLLTDLLSSPDAPHRAAVAGAVVAERAGVRFRLIAKDDLIRMKKSAGRPKDLLDLDALGVLVDAAVRGGGTGGEETP